MKERYVSVTGEVFEVEIPTELEEEFKAFKRTEWKIKRKVKRHETHLNENTVRIGYEWGVGDEAKKKVKALLDEMTPKQRAMAREIMEGRTLDEAAAHLGMTNTAVRSMRYRMKKSTSKA